MLSSKVFSTINRCASVPKSYIHTTSLLKNEPKIEKSINQVTLLGRVGNDPQVRGSEEHPVVTFSLATHNNYRYESGDMLQRTDWHRISIFKPTLREMVSSYMKKGQRIYVTGRLTYGEIKTDDGQVRATTSVIADDVIFLQNSSNNNNNPPEL